MLNPAYQRPIRAFVAILTLVALLSLPLSTFGAKGTGLAASATTLSSKVSVNQLMAFQVVLDNTGKSTLSGLQLEATVTGATNPAAFYWPTSNCIGAGASVTCSFPNLPAGGKAEIVLVFRALAIGNLSLRGVFKAEAKSGTPGAKQDTWEFGPSAPVNVLASSEPFFGGWQVDGVNGTQEFPQIGSSQKTKVTVPPVNSQYWVAYGHIDANVQCGATTYTGFGEAIDLNVNNGNSPVSVEIIFAQQPGLNASTVAIVHRLDNGTCKFPPKVVGCETSSFAECYEPFLVGNGPVRQVGAFVKLQNNGRLKGW